MENKSKYFEKVYEEIIESLKNLDAEDIRFLKSGGKVNRLMKKGGKKPKIHIKESQRGSFTEYCGGKVTSECIARGKKSPNPKIRKKATFAANARKWNH